MSIAVTDCPVRLENGWTRVNRGWARRTGRPSLAVESQETLPGGGRRAGKFVLQSCGAVDSDDLAKLQVFLDFHHERGVDPSMAGEDRNELYEVRQQLETRSEIRRFEARVKSTGARVVFHEVLVDREVVSIEDLFLRVGQYAQLRDVRVPRIIDAWQTGNRIHYVTLEQFGDPLGTPEARIHFETTGRSMPLEVAYQSLSALAALHDQTVLHRRVALDCFVVTPSCMVFMRYHGLNGRIRRLLDDLSGNNISDMLLVANLYACDVCDWAAMVATMLCGMPILDPKKRSDDSLIPEQVAVAVKLVRDHIKNKPFADFLCEAMMARGDSTRGFENGGAAVKAYPQELVP